MSIFCIILPDSEKWPYITPESFKFGSGHFWNQIPRRNVKFHGIFQICSQILSAPTLMLIMYIKSIKYRENIKHKSMKIKIHGHLTTLYMVLFQSSFVIPCSTYDSL